MAHFAVCHGRQIHPMAAEWQAFPVGKPTRGLPKCLSLFYRLGKHRRCPVGGIGRHTWFRSKRESMGVRVPHRAPSSLDVNPRRHARLPRRRSGSSRATVPGERQGSRLLREAALAVAHHPKDTCAPDAGRLFRSCKNPLAFSEPHCVDCPLLQNFCRGGG